MPLLSEPFNRILHSLTHSNQAPTTFERGVALLALADLDSRIANCDANLLPEVGTFERHLIEEKRKGLRAEKQAFQRIISPIRRIPSEIISEILTFAAPDVVDNEGRSAILDLSSVCQDWYKIATLRTPHLWTRVDIQFREFDELDKVVPHLEKWYSRSGCLPLSLHVKQGVLYEPTHFSRTFGFYEFLVQMGRWRELELDVRDIAMFLGIFYCLWTSPNANWSTVKVFRTGSVRAIETSVIPLDRMPKLRELRISTEDLTTDQLSYPCWSGLAKLELQMSSVSALQFSLISECTNLKTLLINLYIDFLVVPISNDISISLPELQTLAFRTKKDSGVVAEFLDRFHVPKLTRLTLNIEGRDKAIDWPAKIMGIGFRSGCKLQILDLAGVIMEQAHFILLLYYLSSLEELYVKGNWSLRPFFNSLHESCLPMLKAIEIVVDPSEFCREEFISFVESPRRWWNECATEGDAEVVSRRLKRILYANLRFTYSLDGEDQVNDNPRSLTYIRSGLGFEPQSIF